MKVTRQFTAWNRRDEGPSRRVRCKELPLVSIALWRPHVSALSQTRRLNGNRCYPSYRPCGTNRGFGRVPGNKLPGYLHLVPSGQRHLANETRFHWSRPFSHRALPIPFQPHHRLMSKLHLINERIEVKWNPRIIDTLVWRAVLSAILVLIFPTIQ
jgi:hypothetical protein